MIAASTSIDIVKLVRLRESPTTSSMVRKSLMGRSESMASMALRISGMILSGSASVRTTTVIARTPPPTESSMGL